MYPMNVSDFVSRNGRLPEAVVRTRRIALLWGIAGGVMMAIAILGLLF